MFVSVHPGDPRNRLDPTSPRTREKGSTPPLLVNLDGTLVRTQLVFESILILIKGNPFFLLRIPLWFCQGLAHFKAQVAAHVSLDPSSLPYDHEFIALLKAERANGRRLWLCTDSNELLATRISQHLQLFDGVLVVAQTVNFEKAPPAVRSRLKTLFQAMRPHQWAKNALLVVPLLAAHSANHPSAVLASLVAMITFCLCASSVYVLNDLLDLEADRANVRKCKRPFAAGLLPLSAGFVLAPALLGVAFSIAAFLPTPFMVVLTGYYVLTLAYSFTLKGKVLVDALVLACLYTLRIVAGAAAVNVPLSFWMLLFSIFLFLSLAFVKRYAELEALRRRGQLQAVGRSYEVPDLPILQSLGCASGYLSVLVLALYVNSPEVEALYRRPQVIWALCALLLFWISRVWMMAQRGAMHDDPVVFALKDRVSVGVGCLAVLVTTLAL